MSDIQVPISLPLDKDKYLRRQCPLCSRQFKIRVEDSELESMYRQFAKGFLSAENQEEDSEDRDECYCPYCGQVSSADSWWTDEQSKFINDHVEDVFAEIVNEQLLKPLGRSARRSKFLEVKTTPLKKKTPWMSPEPDDMRDFKLLCCKRGLKVLEDWKDSICCYYCGFKYNLGDGG